MDKESDRREGKLLSTLVYGDEEEEDDKVHFSDIKKFKGIFWILVVNCAMIYGSFFAFNANSNSML